MADLDLFSPQISQVVKGIEGKTILIYGCNKCGKTYNAVQAPKPLVLAFEQGLGALNGIPYFPIRNWSEFRTIIRKLTDPKNFDTLHEKYNTIIVDAIDGIEKLSARFVCNSLGIDHIRDYNGGFGAWQEWGDEIEAQLRPLAFSGFTVLFIGHEGSRKFLMEDGKTEYEMVYPKGDKRVVDPILNYVDLTCYVRLGIGKDDGDQELSTLYLKGNRGFFAGGRFPEIRPVIREWSYKDLERAIVDAIELREKKGGFKAITNVEARVAEAQQPEPEPEVDISTMPFDALMLRLSKLVKASMQKTGGKTEYTEVRKEAVGDETFRCNKATEDQRPQVEAIYKALASRGYTPEDAE